MVILVTDTARSLLDLDREIKALETSIREVNSQLKAASLRKERKLRTERLTRLKRELFVVGQQLQKSEEEERQPIKVQIISDSIAKHVTDNHHSEVIAFPGIHINQLANKIEKGHFYLDKPVSIIHVGTNDVVHMEAGAMLSCSTI